MLIGKKHCVKAELIATRLLSEEDKRDMLAGLLSMEALEAHVNVWKENGCEDCNKSQI